MSTVSRRTVLASMSVIETAKALSDLLTSAFGQGWGWALVLILSGVFKKTLQLTLGRHILGLQKVSYRRGSFDTLSPYAQRRPSPALMALRVSHQHTCWIKLYHRPLRSFRRQNALVLRRQPASTVSGVAPNSVKATLLDCVHRLSSARRQRAG